MGFDRNDGAGFWWANSRNAFAAYATAYALTSGTGLPLVPILIGLSILIFGWLHALPGSPGRIVVSGRLLDALNDRGRAALLAHEHAHLAGRHHLFTTVAHLAAAANPLLLQVLVAGAHRLEDRAGDARAADGLRRSAHGALRARRSVRQLGRIRFARWQ